MLAALELRQGVPVLQDKCRMYREAIEAAKTQVSTSNQATMKEHTTKLQAFEEAIDKASKHTRRAPGTYICRWCVGF